MSFVGNSRSTGSEVQQRGRVTRDHTPDQKTALVVRKGEWLRTGREDDQWPGWFWCTNDAGTAGWVPEPFLDRDGDRARMRVDYNATELKVRSGDRVTVYEKVNGWWWAEDNVGRRGWVPASHIILL